MVRYRADMTYTIDCVSTERGWQYRVTLWFGTIAYQGQRTYAHYGHAERAAKKTGATHRED